MEITSFTCSHLYGYMSLYSMPIKFQAKEQGKAEVEELLSKLEKVTHQSNGGGWFYTCFKVFFLL